LPATAAQPYRRSWQECSHWETPHLERARGALRGLLELPFERVITAHGEPLHDRAAFEQALERPAWRE